MSRPTLEDLKDWHYASLDSTGRCREDNPLRNWEPADWLTIEQIDATHNWMDKLEKDDGMAPLLYAGFDENTVVACGPPVFGRVYTIYLITSDLNIEGFLANC